MLTLLVMFAYFLAFAFVAPLVDMGTVQLIATAVVGLCVGDGARWVRDNK